MLTITRLCHDLPVFFENIRFGGKHSLFYFFLCSRWLVSLLNFIWESIIWKEEYRESFVIKKGIYNLLDIISVRPVTVNIKIYLFIYIERIRVEPISNCSGYLDLVSKSVMYRKQRSNVTVYLNNHNINK